MVKKAFILFVSCSLLNMNVFASTPLTRGKSVLVRIVSPINSEKGNSQNVNAIVDADVKSEDGKVLIKAGTPVEMQVEAQRARGCGRPGSVSASCAYTTAVDGQRIGLAGSSVEAEGVSKKGLAVGLGVGLGLTFLPFVGLAFLAKKGGNAQINANAVISNAIVTGDYEIE